MKIRERKNKPKFKVIYEYVPSPDGEKRLAEAYRMLFEKVEKMTLKEELSRGNIKRGNIILNDKKQIIE